MKVNRTEVAGIEFVVRIKPIKQRSLPIKGMDAGARHFTCAISRYGWGMSPFVVEYSQGSAIPGNPEPKDILASVVGDALAGLEPFTEFCNNFGYNEDSRAAFATWEACKATEDALARLGIEEEQLYTLSEALESDEL